MTRKIQIYTSSLYQKLGNGHIECSTTGGINDIRQLRRARCGELDPLKGLSSRPAVAAFETSDLMKGKKHPFFAF